MKIAISGATGYIGRYVLNEISRYDVETIAIASPDSKNLPSIKNGRWVHLDIGKPTSNTYNAIGAPDVLIHLAWKGLPNYTSLHHFETELPLQYDFLKNLISQGLKSLLVTGTCFEYGMQSGLLAPDLETCPVNPYGFAKDALRKELKFFKKLNPFKLTWARLFYIHGEGQPEGSLYPQLQKAVVKNKKFFNMSGGEQLRDYLEVEEVAKILITLAIKNMDVGVVNVCSGKPMSVRSMVEYWIKKNNWDINLNLGHYPYLDYEPMAFWGDRRKLDELIKI